MASVSLPTRLLCEDVRNVPTAVDSAREPGPAPVSAAPPAAASGGLDARDSYATTALAEITDRALHATLARFTAGLSPAAMAQAYWDWATHLAFAPGKRAQLVDKALRKALRFANYSFRLSRSSAAAPAGWWRGSSTAPPCRAIVAT